MKKDLSVALTVILVVLGVSFGLSMMRPKLPPTPSAPFTEKAPADTKVEAPAGKIVMRVNGEPITEQEFQAFLAQAPEQMQPYYAGPEGRKLLADQMVKLKALEQEGRRLGIGKDPEAQARIGISTANIIAAYTLQKLVGQPSEAKIRAEYEKEKKNFDSMQLSHILVAYNGGRAPAQSGQPRTQEQAMQKAQAIEARLRSGGDFAQLARSESDDVASGQQGGNLGEVSPQALPPEVQGVVAGLKNGEISQPVKSEFGIHIFKGGPRSARKYEEVRQMFAAKLQRDEMEATLSKLQKSAKVEMDPKFFPPQTPATVPAPSPRGRS